MVRQRFHWFPDFVPNEIDIEPAPYTKCSKTNMTTSKQFFYDAKTTIRGVKGCFSGFTTTGTLWWMEKNSIT